ncbi:MAG TPA: family 43 glycosylhydrolase, partial [Puia sp.]|nr:family 43 glycosylhydrolase [Puia sp.]
MFSADPSARVFGDSVYLYPSHDILANEKHGRMGWFCMEDYHVFASKNLTDWTDDGVVVTQTRIPWARPDGYSMWAPDCIERNGNYYFYFPTLPADTNLGKGFRIGVAVASKPSGPFIAQPKFIEGVFGIDPNVFIDKNGQAYLYWALGNIYGAELKDNMMTLTSGITTIQGLPGDKGLKEGPYVFERNGKYYMTYPHVAYK